MMHIDPGVWWTVYLSIVVTLLFVAPLMPALIELRWPQDAKPLGVVREYDSKVSNFAHGFEHFIDQRFAEALRSLLPTEIRHVPLDADDFCVLMGKSAAFILDGAEHSTLTVRHLLVGAGDVHLPDHVLYEAEVFAAADFISGALSAFRAILARGSAVVGRESVVLRWIHAYGVLQVGIAAQLFGRASSDKRIEMAGGVTFERLHAPEIVFGSSSPAESVWPDAVTRNLCVVDHTQTGGGLWRVARTIELPAASLCQSALVVQGNVRVGAQSWLRLALKSNGNVNFQQQCRVDDAVVASGRIDIGPDCHIKGPIISEVEVVVRRGCTVGTRACPTTISAPRIVIETGVVVFGSVWARDRGEVVLERARETA